MLTLIQMTRHLLGMERFLFTNRRIKRKKTSKEFVLVSNAFVDCRYAFEGVAPSFDFRFLAALANASIRGLLAHYDVKLVPMEEKPMTDAELDKVMEDNRQQFIEKNINYIAKKEKGSLS